MFDYTTGTKKNDTQENLETFYSPSAMELQKSREDFEAFCRSLSPKEDGSKYIIFKLSHNKFYLGEFESSGDFSLLGSRGVGEDREWLGKIEDAYSFLLEKSLEEKGGIFYIASQPSPTAGQKYPLPLKENCLDSDDLHLEFDSGSFEEQLEKIKTFEEKTGLKPNWVVSSGGKSIHSHFRLNRHYPIESIQYANRLLAFLLDSDPAVANPAQAMRCPGFFRKEKGNWQSLIGSNLDAVYSLDEFLAGVKRYADSLGMPFPESISENRWKNFKKVKGDKAKAIAMMGMPEEELPKPEPKDVSCSDFDEIERLILSSCLEAIPPSTPGSQTYDSVGLPVASALKNLLGESEAITLMDSHSPGRDWDSIIRQIKNQNFDMRTIVGLAKQHGWSEPNWINEKRLEKFKDAVADCYSLFKGKELSVSLAKLKAKAFEQFISNESWRSLIDEISEEQGVKPFYGADEQYWQAIEKAKEEEEAAKASLQTKTQKESSPPPPLKAPPMERTLLLNRIYQTFDGASSLSELHFNLEALKSKSNWSNSQWERLLQPISKGEKTHIYLKLEIAEFLGEEDPFKKAAHKGKILSTYKIQSKQFEELAAQLERQQLPKKKTSFSLLEFLEEDLENLNWICPGFLPKGEMILLCADPKVGKSQLAWSIAQAITSGSSLFGEQCEMGKVLVVSSDENPGTTKRRIIAMGLDQSKSEIRIVTSLSLLDLAPLQRELEDFRPSLVVIDSLTSITHDIGISENDADFGRQIYRLKDLIGGYGAASILIHHSNKSQKQEGIHKVSGSNRISAAVWGVWIFSAIGDPKNTSTRFLDILPREGEKTILTLELNPKEEWINKGIFTYLGEKSDPNGEKQSGGQKVVDLLKRVGKPLEYSEIDSYLGMGRSLYTILSRLCDRQIISKRRSKSNPKSWVYFLFNSDDGNNPEEDSDDGNNPKNDPIDDSDDDESLEDDFEDKDTPPNLEDTLPPSSKSNSIVELDESIDNKGFEGLQHLVNTYSTPIQHPFNTPNEGSSEPLDNKGVEGVQQFSQHFIQQGESVSPSKNDESVDSSEQPNWDIADSTYDYGEYQDDLPEIDGQLTLDAEIAKADRISKAFASMPTEGRWEQFDWLKAKIKEFCDSLEADGSERVYAALNEYLSLWGRWGCVASPDEWLICLSNEDLKEIYTNLLTGKWFFVPSPSRMKWVLEERAVKTA